jgi:hypothetical protein
MRLPSISADAAWWEERLRALSDQAAALGSEAADQESELGRLREAIRREEDLTQHLQSQVRIEENAERVAQNELESEQSAMASACKKNSKLDAERRKLLSQISDANWRLGKQARAACDTQDLETATSESCHTVAGRARALRTSLRKLGDAQASLAADEAAERLARRQLRQDVREKLRKQASDRSEMERRCADRDNEVASWRARLEASQLAEKRAVEEAALFRQEAWRCEEEVAPKKNHRAR